MPITTGSLHIIGSGITVECATQERYDTEKANSIAQGYTVTSESGLTMTLSMDKIVDISTGSLDDG